MAMFPADLETRAYRSGNGEFGWTREEARIAISVLEDQQQAILGGELWWVREGETRWTGIIPQRVGYPGVYHWETEREAGEEWLAYVHRCALESLLAVDTLPGSDDLPADMSGRILYNLTWVSEDLSA
jgi:hypothetical protein